MAAGPIVPQRTRGQVFVDVAALAGVLWNQGTAQVTGSTTTALADTVNELTPTANKNVLLGSFLYIYGGTGVDTQREISVYSTLGIMGWSGAIAGAPDATTLWARTRIRPQRIIDAIDSTVRTWAFQHPQTYNTESIVTNSLLGPYGSMDEWTAGNGYPDGWAATGSVAKNSNVVGQGLYSAQLATSATLVYTVPVALLRGLGGQSVRLNGLLASGTAGNTATITATDKAGVTTTKVYTGTYTGSLFEELANISAAPFALPNPVTALTVTLSASAATCWFDDLVLWSPGNPIFEYDLPFSLVGMEPWIEMETEYGGVTGGNLAGEGNRRFTESLAYGRHWDLVRQDSTGTTTRAIRFKGQLPDGRHLRIHGYRASAVGTGAAANTEMNPEAIRLLAAKLLLQQLPTQTNDVKARIATLTADIAALQQPVDKGGSPWVLNGWHGKQNIFLESR